MKREKKIKNFSESLMRVFFSRAASSLPFPLERLGTTLGQLEAKLLEEELARCSV